MKTIAVLNADLVQSPLATPSRLAREMNGVPILAQTVSRVLKIHSVEGVYVLCPTDQRDRCARILTGMNVTVCQHDAGPPPWATLVRTARKWSLDAWRGGIGGATCFDEYTDARLIAGLLETTSADAVLSLPPAAMLFDPALGEKIIAHRKKISDEAKMSFVQAPPGLTAILLDSDVVGELAEKRLPVGTIFGYKPQAPQKDMIFEPCCCPTPADLRFATGRLIADTDRAVERISRILSSGCSADAETMGRHLIERDERGSEPFPYEVEIELTTDDPYPANLLRPRGKKVPPRGPIPVDCICKVADELAERDDALCVLAGFGDPLRHPQLPAILDALRPAPGGGVYGLAVVTAGVDLTDNVINLLISHRVDVVSVTLDAWTPETYQALQSPGGETSARLDVVLEKLDRLASLRADRRSVAPLVVPTFCKSRENLHEMDAFYDGWMQRLGIVSVTGFNHYGHRIPDRSVIRMAPSDRTPCGRVRSRAMILANGMMVLCDQDFEGEHTFGHVAGASIAELWSGAKISRVRDSHISGGRDQPEICGPCDEWHRP